MRIGNLGWAIGWTGATIALTVMATLVGPGRLDGPSEPVPMIRVEGGAFLMGAESGTRDERPVHTVRLKAFEIDQLPVVNAQFAAFLSALGGAGGPNGTLYTMDTLGAKIRRVGERFVVEPGYEQHPVAAATWQGARAYCAARGARLPTEAEWERAARGPAGRTYPWGEEPPDASRARFAYRPFDYRAVGSYPAGATPEGILDMAGNAWQWTSSLYRPYPYRADDGREDPDASGERVVRGGSESSSPEMLRSSFRSIGMSQMPPANRPAITFRCAREAA
jgi:iron(II)-dependent oxidoreductase